MLEGSPYALGWLGAIIIVYALLWMLRKPIQYIVGFIIQAFVGGVALIGLNWLFQGLSIPLFVGLNLVTGAIVGLLGLPGILFLYAISYLYQ